MKKTIAFSEIEPLLMERLQAGDKVTLGVQGNSMNPFFWSQKTSVTIAPIQDDVKRFDVVLAKSQDKAILHRVMKIDSNHVVLQGDANRTQEIICQEEILGKVISFERGKTTLVTQKRYRFWMRVWMAFRFARPVLICLWRRLHRDALV